MNDSQEAIRMRRCLHSSSPINSLRLLRPSSVNRNAMLENEVIQMCVTLIRALLVFCDSMREKCGVNYQHFCPGFLILFNKSQMNWMERIPPDVYLSAIGRIVHNIVFCAFLQIAFSSNPCSIRKDLR
jgi:hypothetical protein